MSMRVVLAGLAGVFLLHGQMNLPRTLADADKLEAQVESNPADLDTRLTLLRYYWNGQTTIPVDRVKAALRKHAVWIIEQHPDYPSLSGEMWAAIPREGRMADSETFDAADQAWRKHLAETPAAPVIANAIRFYKFPDPAFARKIAEDGLKTYPGNEGIGTGIGMLDAIAILGMKGEDRYGMASSFDDTLASSQLAKRAREELDATTSAAILGGAGDVLVRQVFQLAQHRRNDAVAPMTALAEKLLRRAMELDRASPRWSVSLSLMYTQMAPRAATAAEKIKLYEQALQLTEGEKNPLASNRMSLVTDMARARYDAGDYVKAAADAREALRLAPENPNYWAYGNAIHYGNIVLGQIAMRDGDRAEAARRLLVAGGTKGSPQLNSFGPDWKLAGELLANGDTAAVLSYLELCRKFWTTGAQRLDSWAAAIRAGGTPNFSSSPELTKPDLTGRPAPAFTLPKFKGGTVSLSEFKGKVVLVDFWATWCAPCRAEMPTFQKLYREFEEKDVVILAVDVGEAEDTVAEYINKEKYTFPVLLANESDMAKNYGVNAYPTLVAVDRDGRVADYLIGGRDEATLRSVIEKARAGAPPPGATPRAPSAMPRPATVPVSSEIVPLTPDDFYRDGVRRRGAGDLNGALQSFDRANELHPDWAAALIARANVYVGLRLYDKAIADLNRAIALDPKRAATYDQRGLCYSNSNRHAQALPDYARAIELNGGVSGVYNNRGWAYLELGQLDEALADLKKSLELNPANTVALGNLSRLHVMRKQYAEAIADCDAALLTNPTLTWATERKSVAKRLMAGPAQR